MNNKDEHLLGSSEDRNEADDGGEDAEPPYDNMGVDNDTGSVNQPLVDGGEEPPSETSQQRVPVKAPSGQLLYVKRLGKPEDYFYKLALDTLQVSVRGMWKSAEASEHLLEMRSRAESAKVLNEEILCYRAHDGTELQVYPHGGRPTYRVLMRDADGMELRACPTTNMPPIIIRFGARWCVENDITDLARWIFREADEIGFAVDKICLSEVHIRCDVPTAFTASDREGLRGVGTRNAQFNFHEHKGQFTGLNNLGGSKAVSFTIYDKRLEQKQKRNLLWAAMWKAYGISKDSPIWRVEARFKRDTLTKRGLDLIEDLNAATIKGLWHAFSSQYIQMVDPGAGRTDRACVLPKWEKLQQCGEQMQKSPIDAEVNWEADSLITQAIGCIASFASRSGIVGLERGNEKMDELVDSVMRSGLEEGRRRIQSSWTAVLKRYLKAQKAWKKMHAQVEREVEDRLPIALKKRLHAKPWKRPESSDEETDGGLI